MPSFRVRLPFFVWRRDAHAGHYAHTSRSAMTPYFARSLTASLGLHVTVAGIALLLLMLGPRAILEPEAPRIVTLLPSNAFDPAAPDTSSSQQIVVPMPKPPVRGLEPETRPAPVAPPATTQSPTPKPVAPPTTRTPTKSPATTVTATTSHGPTMSYHDFIAQHGPPTPPKKKPTSAASVPAPRISTDFIQVDLATGSRESEAADPRFIDALIARLRGAFMASGTWPENFTATVSFTVQADGTLGRVKLVRSSDIPAFDAAALAACRQTRLKAVPPGEAGQSYQVGFRSEPAR